MFARIGIMRALNRMRVQSRPQGPTLGTADLARDSKVPSPLRDYIFIDI